MAIQKLGKEEIEVVAGGLTFNINLTTLRSALNAFSASLTSTVNSFHTTVTASLNNLQTLVANTISNWNNWLSTLKI